MTRGPLIHGVLLAGALGVAWQTFTRDKSATPSAATLTVWSDAGAIESVALKGGLRDLKIERRTEAGGDYSWATVKKTAPPPAKPAAADGGVAPPTSPLEDQGTTTTQQFPVGDEGEKALGRLAPLRAIRDLGSAAGKDEYGFGDASDKLSVKLGGKTHELTLGARVFGGDDRYVLDPAGGHVYVIAGDVLRPFDAPEFSLRDRKLHGFQPTDVADVVLKAGGKERTLAHVPKTTPGAGAEHPSGALGWADAQSPDKPDQTLANFMERVEQLAPLEYAQTPDNLTPVGSLEYRAKGGKVLGTVELAKRPAATAGQFEYYVKTERTHGLAKVSPAAGGRVDQDLVQVLQ